MPHTRDIPFKTIINSADSVRIRNGLDSGKQLRKLFDIIYYFVVLLLVQPNLVCSSES